MFKKFFDKIKKFFFLNILRKKYIRKGQCNSCGKCCQEIYVKHGGGVIKDEEEFKRLQKLHWFYSYLEIVDNTEDGLVFRCTKLDPVEMKCTVYKHRALLCRLYPQEEIFMMGGIMGEQCGFTFEPIESFEEILDRVKCK